MQISSFILLEMKMTSLLLKVILLVGIFTEISLSQDTGQAMKPVRCEVSAVHMGREGHITCHYPMDLDQQSIDLNVVVEQFVGQSDKHVLDCLWDDVMRCTDVRQGYKITKVTFNTLTTTISTVMEEHLGRYRCLLADKMKVYDSEFCDLLGPFPGTPQPEETDQSGSDASLSVGAITAIVIGLLSVIVILVFGVWLCTERRCERAKRHIIPSTLECKEMNTGSGGTVAEETGDKDRNGRLCSVGSGSGFADTKTETEAAVTLLIEDDEIRDNSSNRGR